MDRIESLLKKIEALKKQPSVDILDIDLMIDYVKVIYADLLEWREQVNISISNILTKEAPEALTENLDEEIKQPETVVNSIFSLSIEEPTLEELTQAFEKESIKESIESAYSDTKEPLSDIPNPNHNNIAVNPEVPPPAQIERLETIDTTPVATPLPKPKDDIRKYIGINEKFIFINELFHGNKVAYEEVLSELSFFLNTDDAIEWLQNTVVKPYEWKVDDFTVQDFYRVIDSYYSRIR